MIVAVDADLGQAEAVGQETLLLFGVAHRHGDRVESAHRSVGLDLLGRPALGLVVLVLDHLEVEAGGVAEVQRLLAETLALPGDLGVVALEMLLPEFQRAERHRIAGRVDLAGPAPAGNAHLREREGGRDRADLGIRVGVVEVVKRDRTVEQDGLLDHALADHLREEVDVFLRTPDTAGDMVQSVDACGHLFSLPDWIFEPDPTSASILMTIGTLSGQQRHRQEACARNRCCIAAFCAS